MGVRVSGAYQEVVSDAVRMKQLFQRGNSRRQTSSHNLNAVSSRSHAIFQIMVQCRRANSSAVQVSTINFVDLAGSERIEKSGSEFEPARTKEAASINVSLLMLGNVISKLAERSMRSTPSSKLKLNRLGSPAHAAQSSPDHIPYRNSKLTRLLQPSLGGNARTAIIATINPSADQADETFHTLRYVDDTTLSMVVTEQTHRLDLQRPSMDCKHNLLSVHRNTNAVAENQQKLVRQEMHMTSCSLECQSTICYD